MGPPIGLVAASVISAHANVEQVSLLQAPIVNQELAADEDECRCPGYFREECEAHAAQGCVWTDAGSSNAPWCQCVESNVVTTLFPAVCPDDWVQVGEAGADIEGCGYDGCDGRYDTSSEAECAAKCDAQARRGCDAFSYAPVNGDRDHEGESVCTLYRSDVPTGTVTATTGAAVQVFCKRRDWFPLWTMSGCPHDRFAYTQTRSNSGTTASVQCCAIAYRDRRNGVEPQCFTEDVGGCQSEKTYDEAVAICSELGGRLCSSTDLGSEASGGLELCCGGGCGFDDRPVWICGPTASCR